MLDTYREALRYKKTAFTPTKFDFWAKSYDNKGPSPPSPTPSNPTMPSYLSQFIAGCLIVIASTVQAQPGLQLARPSSIVPGQATEVVLVGDKLSEPLKIWTSIPLQTELVSITSNEIRLKVTALPTTPIGPFGITVAGADGVAAPLGMLVDPLPTISEAADNHDVAHAQVLTDRCAVDGVADGAASDFFRIRSTADQRLTLEVRTNFISSNLDPVIRVLDSNGNEIAGNDDLPGSSECRLTIDAKKDVEYLLELRDSKYVAGGRYRLRIGDFLPVQTLFPPVVTAGQVAKFTAGTSDANDVSVNDWTAPITTTQTLSYVPVGAATGAGNWGSVLVTPRVAVIENEQVENDPTTIGVALPVVLAGRIKTPGDQDRFLVTLKKGESLRCTPWTGALQSPAWLKIKILHPDGRMLAESPVNEASEWRFDFSPPEDAVYQVVVEELLGRGGNNFVYALQLDVSGYVTAALKGDANGRDRLVLSGVSGAVPFDFVLDRFGYDGAVQFSAKNLSSTYRILNPVAAAGTKEHRVWVVAQNGASLADVPLSGLQWEVMAAESGVKEPSSITSRAIWRLRAPTLPYPALWRDGWMALAVSNEAEPFFKLTPTPHVLSFPAGTKQIKTTIALERTKPEFKEAPQWFVSANTTGAVVQVTQEGDVTHITVDRADEKQMIRGKVELVAVAEFAGKGRRELIAFDIESAPDRLEVFPSEIALTHAKDKIQLVVSAIYPNGDVRDVTRAATMSVTDDKIAALVGSDIVPRGDGETSLKLNASGVETTIPVRVSNSATIQPIGFETGALVALSKQNCSSGACHGSPSGKGGFRLSLRAYDPVLDQLTLLREETGRRVNILEPEASLLLEKPLMKVVHGGGVQIRKDDAAYQVLKQWIAEGAQLDPANAPRVARLQIYPAGKRVLRSPADSQQISVVAVMTDGSTKDVTDLAGYSVSDTSVCTVDANGLVKKQKRGEAAVLVRFLEHIESLTLTFVEDEAAFAWTNPPVNNYIDERVNDKLKLLQYSASPTCSDSEFLRRVHLDVIGILPTLEETEAFLAETDPTKRSKLIDRLLERPEYARFWAVKWGDLLKMTNKKIGPDGLYKYHRWVEDSIRKNVPYDRFARELLTASGSNLENPAANFYRAAVDMNDCVETISQVFLGSRLQCAKCHNHPFERWTQDNYYGMGAFFERVRRTNTPRPNESLVWTAQQGEVTQPRTGKVMQPWVPVQGTLSSVDEQDRRRSFADWLVQPNNPYFAKMEVNRIWAQLFSRGIVDPIDDFRDSNPPSNVELLDALAQDFVKSGFDRKHILRTILNSRTYQASFEPLASNKEDEKYFSHQMPRLLSAEQLMDAVVATLGVAEPLGGLPADRKATQLPAPDIVKVDFLKVFGQPERETVCACERSKDTNLGMAIEFFNGSFLHGKLKHPQTRFRQALAAQKPIEQIIREVYLAAVCRPPTESELQAALKHVTSHSDPALAMEDVCWALVNTDEFIFQH